AQTRRDQDARTAVHFEIHRVTYQQTLQDPVLLIQGGQYAELFLDPLPLDQGIDVQSGVIDVDGHDELACTTRNELVTIPTRHREAPFGVETDGISSAKHACASPLSSFPCP